MICFPSNSSLLYKSLIWALDCLMPRWPKSILSLYVGLQAWGKIFYFDDSSSPQFDALKVLPSDCFHCPGPFLVKSIQLVLAALA